MKEKYNSIEQLPQNKYTEEQIINGGFSLEELVNSNILLQDIMTLGNYTLNDLYENNVTIDRTLEEKVATIQEIQDLGYIDYDSQQIKGSNYHIITHIVMEYGSSQNQKFQTIGTARFYHGNNGYFARYGNRGFKLEWISINQTQGKLKFTKINDNKSYYLKYNEEFSDLTNTALNSYNIKTHQIEFLTTDVKEIITTLAHSQLYH